MAETVLPISQSIPCDALKGYRVVELTEYVAAPMCGRMLADYGAEVIKIERPTGDPYRHQGDSTECGAKEDENPLFDVLNAGKKSVVLNLKDPADMENFHKLLADADIFLTSTRLASLKKMGLDPDTLLKKYPRLVFGLITGFGIDGPEKDDPGYDSVAFWGRSGFMLSVPYEDADYPFPPPSGVGDSVTGITLLTGLLSALLKRERTGKGDFVTASLLGSAIWVNNNMLLMTQPKYGEKYPISRSESNPVACGYKCSDGRWFQIGVMDYERYIPAILNELGIPEYLEDPRFKSILTMKENREEILKIFEQRFILKSSREWLEIMKGHDIVCSILPYFGEVASDKQAWANGNIEEYYFRNGNSCSMPCSPVRFGSTGIIRTALGPKLGEHTNKVLEGFTN